MQVQLFVGHQLLYYFFEIELRPGLDPETYVDVDFNDLVVYQLRKHRRSGCTVVRCD